MPLLTVIPGSPICSEASGTVACTLGTLGNGSTTEVTTVAGVDPTTRGTLTNTARATAETPSSSPACGEGRGGGGVDTTVEQPTAVTRGALGAMAPGAARLCPLAGGGLLRRRRR